MATPLIRKSFPAPGRLGFNADQAATVQNHEWGLRAQNVIVNEAERIESRPGWVNSTTTGNHANDTNTIHEYIVDGTTVEIISVAGSGTSTKFYEGTTTLTDITGTATLAVGTTDQFALLNFNGKVVGLDSTAAIVYTSGGAFADITVASGTAPASNIACVSHGRIWAADSDLQTIKWCALLDETHWTTGAGSLDLSNVWPDGLDQITAIAPYQGKLVIFGERSILMYDGLEDPATNLDLAGSAKARPDDAIRVGAVGKDAVVSIGQELIFLSRSGIRSLTRAIEYERLPVNTRGDQAVQVLIDDIDLALTNSERITMAYHEPLGGIVARIGSKYWYMDTKRQDILRLFVWTGDNFSFGDAVSSEGKLYYGVNGGIGEATGYLDDDTESYSMEWISPWIPVEENGRIFIPKRAIVFAESGTQYEVSIRWSFDYEAKWDNASGTLMASSPSEYNTEGSQRGAEDEYGQEGAQDVAEYGARNQVVLKRFRLTGFGSLIQFGFSVTVNNDFISLQQIDLFGKLGRLFR